MGRGRKQLSRNTELRKELIAMHINDLLVWDQTPYGSIHAIVSREFNKGGDFKLKTFTYNGKTYIVRVA